VYGCVNFALMVPCLIYAIVRAVIGKKTSTKYIFPRYDLAMWIVSFILFFGLTILIALDLRVSLDITVGLSLLFWGFYLLESLLTAYFLTRKIAPSLNKKLMSMRNSGIDLAYHVVASHIETSYDVDSSGKKTTKESEVVTFKEWVHVRVPYWADFSETLVIPYSASYITVDVHSSLVWNDKTSQQVVKRLDDAIHNFVYLYHYDQSIIVNCSTTHVYSQKFISPNPENKPAWYKRILFNRFLLFVFSLIGFGAHQKILCAMMAPVRELAVKKSASFVAPVATQEWLANHNITPTSTRLLPLSEIRFSNKPLLTEPMFLNPKPLYILEMDDSGEANISSNELPQKELQQTSNVAETTTTTTTRSTTNTTTTSETAGEGSNPVDQKEQDSHPPEVVEEESQPASPYDKTSKTSSSGSTTSDNKEEDKHPTEDAVKDQSHSADDHNSSSSDSFSDKEEDKHPTEDTAKDQSQPADDHNSASTDTSDSEEQGSHSPAVPEEESKPASSDDQPSSGGNDSSDKEESV